MRARLPCDAQAFDSLLNLAHRRSIGPAHIAASILKRLGKKQTSHHKWRPIATRLLLLKQLVDDFGLAKGGEQGNLTTESVMGFVEVFCERV